MNKETRKILSLIGLVSMGFAVSLVAQEQSTAVTKLPVVAPGTAKAAVTSVTKAPAPVPNRSTAPASGDAKGEGLLAAVIEKIEDIQDSIKPVIPTVTKGVQDPILLQQSLKAAQVQDRKNIQEAYRKMSSPEIMQELKEALHADWKPEQPKQGEDQGSWEVVPAGQANDNLVLTQISVGDQNNIWAAARGEQRVYRLGKAGWEPMTDGVYVSVGNDGTVMILDGNNAVYEWVNGDRKLVPNLELSSVSVADKDDRWGVFETKDATGAVVHEVYHYQDGAWVNAQNALGEDAYGLLAVSVNADGDVLAIKDDKDHSAVRCNIATRSLVEENQDQVKAVLSGTAPLPKGVVVNKAAPSRIKGHRHHHRRRHHRGHKGNGKGKENQHRSRVAGMRKKGKHHNGKHQQKAASASSAAN